jgi:hypothetical protein
LSYETAFVVGGADNFGLPVDQVLADHGNDAAGTAGNAGVAEGTRAGTMPFDENSALDLLERCPASGWFRMNAELSKVRLDCAAERA